MKSVKLTSGESVAAASTKLVIAAGCGLVAAVVVGVLVSWKIAPLVLWDVAAATYMVNTWRRVLRFDAGLVKRHALREDPSRVITDVILLVASVVSLAAVVAVLAGASSAGGAQKIVLPVLSVLSVVVSWFMIHTVYALRYAEMYYSSPAGGVDFGDSKEPVYSDFAYLAFTLGMTYQVSDTTLQAHRFRIAALKQALLSYLFGTIIIATTINLVAGLAK